MRLRARQEGGIVRKRCGHGTPRPAGRRTVLRKQAQRRYPMPDHPVRTQVSDMSGRSPGLRVSGSTAPSQPFGPVAFRDGPLPLTVAGAATASVPVGQASPCSLLIPNAGHRSRTGQPIIEVVPGCVNRRLAGACDAPGPVALQPVATAHRPHSRRRIVSTSARAHHFDEKDALTASGS